MTHRANGVVRFKLVVVLCALIDGLKGPCATLPDRRKGANTVYDMADIGLAACSMVFMQSPSFLAQQTALERRQGASNCRTLFQMTRGCDRQSHPRDA